MSELQLSALLIEDDDRLARFTADFLEQNGVCVTRCGDGEEGLAAALRKTYDAVILDLMLPRRDGLDVCKRIRAQSNVPIIVVTARVDEVDRRRQSVRARMPRSDRAREAPTTDCANRAAAAASRCVDAIAQSRARVGAFAGSLADEPTTVCWRLAHVRRSMARKSPN